MAETARPLSTDVDLAQFVHENATVIVGNDEESGFTIIFVVKSNGAVAFSFPTHIGEGKTLSAAEVELFTQKTEPSPMLTAIKAAWSRLRPS